MGSTGHLRQALRVEARAAADADAQLIQLLGHARATVAAKAQAMLIADMGQEHHVTPLTMRRGPVLLAVDDSGFEEAVDCLGQRVVMFGRPLMRKLVI